MFLRSQVRLSAGIVCADWGCSKCRRRSGGSRSCVSRCWQRLVVVVVVVVVAHLRSAAIGLLPCWRQPLVAVGFGGLRCCLAPLASQCARRWASQ